MRGPNDVAARATSESDLPKSESGDEEQRSTPGSSSESESTRVALPPKALESITLGGRGQSARASVLLLRHRLVGACVLRTGGRLVRVCTGVVLSPIVRPRDQPPSQSRARQHSPTLFCFLQSPHTSTGQLDCFGPWGQPQLQTCPAGQSAFFVQGLGPRLALPTVVALPVPNIEVDAAVAVAVTESSLPMGGFLLREGPQPARRSGDDRLSPRHRPGLGATREARHRNANAKPRHGSRRLAFALSHPTW